MQKIVPFLWFDNQAEEAATFYTSVFPNSRIRNVTRYGAAGAEASGMPADSVMTVEFELNGLEFVALNGGPAFAFSPAVSFAVGCDTQEEVDYLWERLSEGGNTQQCGWLTDKYEVTWQITPTVLPRMLQDADKRRSERVMKAMVQMVKLDIALLEQAYEQG